MAAQEQNRISPYNQYKQYISPALSALGGVGLMLGGNPRAARTTNVPVLTPAQQQASLQALQQANELMQGPNSINNQSMRHFQQEIIPSIMERFSTLGAPGTKYGSLDQALAGAGHNLEATLAAQNRNQMNDLYRIGMQPQFQSMYEPENIGMGQQIGQSLFGSIGDQIGTIGNDQRYQEYMNRLLPEQQKNLDIGMQAQSPQNKQQPWEAPSNMMTQGGSINPIALINSIGNYRGNSGLQQQYNPSANGSGEGLLNGMKSIGGLASSINPIIGAGLQAASYFPNLMKMLGMRK